MEQQSGRRNWALDNPVKARVIVAVLCVLAVEAIVRLVVWVGLLPYERYPTSREPQYWAYIDPVVGMWRYPNADFVDEGRCYTAHYTSNSVGARDRERAMRSSASRRVMVLGDSFVEGYGFDEAGRFTDLLERRTGIEHLNWGTSGSFGTIQEWLLYESRVRQYDHTDVMLFILPDNDFKDNDPGEFSHDTYRPYLRETPDGYEVYYPVAFEDRYTASRGVGAVIKNTLDNSLYTLNALRLANRMFKDRGGELLSLSAEPTYTSYDQNDRDVFFYSLDRIVQAVDGRRLHLFLIPREFDLDYVEKNGYAFELVDELNALARQHDNVSFVDLLPSLAAYADTNGLASSAFSLGCDEHWGALGHKVVADIVYEHVFGSP